MSLITQHLEEEFHVSWYIIFYKLALGVIEFATGLGIALAGNKIFTLYRLYVTGELSEDPHDLLARLSERVIPHVFTHNAFLITYLLILGSAKIAGAIGLIYGKNWGVDLLVGLTAVMFPFQFIHLFIHPSALDAIYIFVGLFIALYLINFKPKAWFHRVTRHHGRNVFS
jgi:uncharacterized membrane protein